jgi:hypothetical protein
MSLSLIGSASRYYYARHLKQLFSGLEQADLFEYLFWGIMVLHIVAARLLMMEPSPFGAKDVS